MSSRNPPTNPAEPSPKLKKLPSSRISHLVSRFEPPTPATSSSTPAAPSNLSELPAYPPVNPSTLARSWSKVSGGGRVERNVRRFSTNDGQSRVEAGPPEREQSRRTDPLRSVASVDGKDSNPRTKPSASPSVDSPIPLPPAARFRHPHLTRPSTSSEGRTQVPGIPSTPYPKSSAAATIFVPASINSSPSNGKTRVNVTQGEDRSSATSSNEPAKKGGGQGEEISARETNLSTPPLPPRSKSFDSISSASPSFATSEVTFVEVRRSDRPTLEHRKTSLAEPLLQTFSRDSGSTLIPASPRPLDLPPYRPPPPSGATRPRLCPPPRRGGTTSSTAATTPHSYPAHEVFARNAVPLYLPDLDVLLDESLRSGPEFSTIPVNLDNPKRGGGGAGGIELEYRDTAGENVFGSEEEETSWNDWVRGEPPNAWERFKSRWSSSSNPTLTSLDDGEDDKERLVSRRDEEAVARLTKEQCERSLMFPPFHRIPRDSTLSDLKSNIRKPPPLFSGHALLQTVADGALNLFGSAAGIRLTTVEGLRDLMQMITLLVSSASPSLSLLTVSSSSSSETSSSSSASTLRTLFVTVPSALSLDFASAFGHALIFLFVLTLVSFFALYEFFRFTGGWKGPSARGQQQQGAGDHPEFGEGYDQSDLDVENRRKVRNRKGYRTLITFYLTTVYLPLSKLSLSALFWDRGYSPSSGSGTRSTSRMTMTRDQCFTTIPLGGGGGGFNAAIVMLPTAFIVLVVLGCWFPLRMYRVVQRAKPKVDKWTELGELRRDKKGEYERLLDRDPSPFSFLYREYRREWAAFRSIYMAVKLFNVLIVVLISTDNCVFVGFKDENRLDVVRQGTLFAFMGLFFLLDVYSRPQLDEISNRSDRVSRLGYVGIALCGLLVALKVRGQTFFEGTAIVLLNVFAYSFNFYFAIIGTQLLRRFVKRVQRRLDFSIDVFAPNLDLSKHVSRRIWQETFSTLFLTVPELRMQEDTKLVYVGDPPYLLNFEGTVAERHAENLKILREIGLDAYFDAALPTCCARLERVRQTLLHEIAGPDVYYCPSATTTNSATSSPPMTCSSNVTTFFGRLDIVPFPFIAVFRYDQTSSTTTCHTPPLRFSKVEQLEELVRQQSLDYVQRARKVRRVLRSLEGQKVYSPRIESRLVKKRGGKTRGGFEVSRLISYEFAEVQIRRNSGFVWRGYNCSSGFNLEFEWRDGRLGNETENETTTTRRRKRKRGEDFKLVLTGAQFGGINSNFELTQPLAVLFKDNRKMIDERLPLIEEAIEAHRKHFAQEIESKRRTLSYEFLFTVFAQDRLSMKEVEAELGKTERNERVRNLVKSHPTTFRALEERMKWVTANKVTAWWFILWDDLYRRNDVFHERPRDFSPRYSSSICYQPMSRTRLERFLSERGKLREFFSCGFLNQIYFVLDEIAFSSTDRAVPIHLGSSSPSSPPIHYSSLARNLSPPPPKDPSLLNSSSAFSSLTAGTGDGTNEDDRFIRPRREFLFERAFSETPPPRPLATTAAAAQKGQRFTRALDYFVRKRLGSGIKRWLGWTLNEEMGRKGGGGGGGKKRRRDEEILLDLTRDEQGWKVPHPRPH